MFPDPDKLPELSPAEVLDAAARGQLGLDHRFLHALLDRPEEALPAVLAFARRDRRADAVDLAPELIALLRYWKTPEALPILIDYIREDAEEAADELLEALVEIGQPALEPLLALYEELPAAENGDVAFILASLGIRDERILKILIDRLDDDVEDAAFLLGIYGDPAAKPALEAAAATVNESDRETKRDVDEALASIATAPPQVQPESKPFAIWEIYPERADLPLELLDEDQRFELLQHPADTVRSVAAHSFFNHELNPAEQEALLELAQHDASADVRGRAWEALMNQTEESAVIDAMLRALRSGARDPEERGGLLVGLASESDRNEVRQAMVEFYEVPGGRAKALEAMWRSVHPSFREYFAKHLDDAELEVRRSAIWGIGYYGLRSELERVRKLFEDEELRSDALFAYALALPTEVSRGRVKGLLARVDKDANGLSELEEELVKMALDERLMLAGKEPVFASEED